MCRSNGPSVPRTPGIGLAAPPVQTPPVLQSGSRAHLPLLVGLGVSCLKQIEVGVSRFC